MLSTLITIAVFQVILGHHFVVGKATAARHHCDHCSGIIWSVVQASYACTGE